MENRISVCREYAELWQNFFQYLNEDYDDVEINEDMEREFEQVVTVLALNHYKFAQLCGEYMKDTDAVMNTLAGIVNLEHIKNMDDSTLSKIIVDAHTLLIDMHKALGRMIAQLTPKQLEAMQNEQQQPAGEQNPA